MPVEPTSTLPMGLALLSSLLQMSLFMVFISMIVNRPAMPWFVAHLVTTGGGQSLTEMEFPFLAQATFGLIIILYPTVQTV
uniref:Uncharacterized protein n=1 Tax=Rhizophora mucronata TaxID=61149 RepID=A0A2P2QPX4_RHIMU